MPIYEYKCGDCDKVSDHYVTTGSAHDIKCPGCGGKNLERIKFSTFAVTSGSSETSCQPSPSCGSCCACKFNR